MNKNKLKSIISLLGTLFIGLHVFAGHLEEFSKVYHQEYSVNSDVLLNISNKYGKIKVITSETDRVTIDVLVMTEGKSEVKSKEVLDKINIEFYGEASKVTAKTLFDDHAKFKNLTIDYTITMPINGSVELINKFGDVYVNELNGSSVIKIAYGDLIAGKLNSKNNNVTIKFGDAKISYVNYLYTVLRYSDIKINKVKLFDLDTQYGDANVGEVGRMIFDGQYSDVRIGTIVELVADIRYGDITVEGVLSSVKLDSEYGDANFKLVSKGFKNIDVNTSFGDVDIDFESGSKFVLDGTASYGDVKIPQGTLCELKENGEVKKQNVKSEPTVSTVKVKVSYGDLDIGIR